MQVAIACKHGSPAAHQRKHLLTDFERVTQIRRYKEKIQDHRRDPSMDGGPEAVGASPE